MMQSLAARQKARGFRRCLLLSALALCAVMGVLTDIAAGPSGLSIKDVIDALMKTEGVARSTDVIVWKVRLPVAIMALVVGAALSLAGTEMQTVLENPLAEPFTLGVSSAAALGAGLAIVVGVSIPGLPHAWSVTANAFLFAILSLVILQFAAGRGSTVVVLFGIALNFTAGALLSLVQFIASADALQQLVFWTMGSLVNVRWDGIILVSLALACTLPFSLRASWALSAVRMGSAQAQGFGVDVNRLRRWALVRVSLLAAAAVSMVGVIGFVGLAGPHIARFIIGEDHRFLIPASLLTGAIIMSFASITSKLLVPGVLLPIGMVTSLVGLPVFFTLILKRSRRSL